MSAADHQSAAPVRRVPYWRSFGRKRGIALALVILVLVALAAVWLARVPIAARVIDRELASAGVPARYAIADLGLGRQRLTDVVLGDPADPDLVADWIETRTSIGLGGAAVTGIRAGRVRMRATLGSDGQVSFGVIDRLLPPPSGTPFALPAIDLAIADGRMRLTTAYGVAGLRLSGSGRLDDGFSGTLAATMPRLTAGDCAIDDFDAVVAITMRNAAPIVRGPVRAARAGCGAIVTMRPTAQVDVALSPALDRWDGGADVAVARAQGAGVTLGQASGRIDLTGDADRTMGRIDVTAARVAAAAASARRVAIDGAWRTGSRFIFAGRARATDAMVSTPLRRRLAGFAPGAAGTPVAPLTEAIGRAAARAATRFDVAADLAIATGATPLVTIEHLDARAASGARARFVDGTILIGDRAGPRLDGTLTLAEGGLPSGRIAVRQTRAGAPIRGEAVFAPFAANDARLALSPIRFAATTGRLTAIDTVATVSGPLGDGRVDAMRLPLSARWDGAGVLSVNPACAALTADRIAIAGLTLDAVRVPLCPVAGAMLRLADGRIDGGVRIGAARLAGRLGTTPVMLAASSGEVMLRATGFTVAGVETRLGAGAAATRLDFGTIAGRLTADGVMGSFTGGGGQIGAVPLILSDATGDWRLAGGDLTLTGALGVSDAAAEARFEPMAARDVRLSLADNRITANGRLVSPGTDRAIGTVRITHALASGRGMAHLDVPGITFGDGLQPEQLTRLTFGVIADVHGTVSGGGDIAWGPDGVTSTGQFTTPDTDLAAAFGPVEGLATTIRFTDLLALESAPGQVATVASINPGIAVTDGVIRYQTLRGTRVQVERGIWPFAGGTLTLQPTLLDFSSSQPRLMTFDVAGMEAAPFLQKFDFDNLDATGTFDGTLPMVFGELGGRIEGGQLQVRAGGGTIAYVGEIGEENLGFWGNFAFQALKSLRYRNLTVVMNGPLAGDMVTEVRFAGIGQGVGAKRNFILSRIAKLPFVFNIRVKAPFRSLIDATASFYDPSRLIERNLPALIEEQNRRAAPAGDLPVQPPASENLP